MVILKFGAYGSAEFDSASIPWLSEQLFGTQVKTLISVIGFFACFASINLYTQSLSRMIWAQAREHNPSGKMATLSRRGVPINATLLVGSVLALACVIGELSGLDLEFFLKLANNVFVLIYLLAMLAAFKLLNGHAKWLMRRLIDTLLVGVCLSWLVNAVCAECFCSVFSTSEKANEQG